MVQINKAQGGAILQLGKVINKAKSASHELKRIFMGESAAEKYLNKMAGKKILEQKSSWRPIQKMRNANLERKKQAIRDYRAMRSAASKAELEWMQANPDKATKIYKSGAKEFGGEANKQAIQKVRQEAMQPFINAKAAKIRKNRAIATAIPLSIPILAALGEGAYNGINNIINSSDETTFNDVKNDQDFINYLYKSGGEEAPFFRKINNVSNVLGNYFIGLFNPHGRTMLDLGEGTERQAVAAALNNLNHGGNESITDADHLALGGKHGDSGKSFHQQNNDSNFALKIFDQAKNAVNLPYHNIYGQSAGNTFDENGFHSHDDNYTFNNVWGKKPNGKVGVVKILNDGEGDAGFLDALDQTIKAAKDGVRGVQPLMETMASLRGVDTKRHKDVSDISMEQLNKWAKEYNRQKR